MPGRSYRRFVGAVSIASLLAGCAQQYPPTTVAGEPPPPPPVYAGREFCSYEWVCVLAGFAVLGGVIAIMKNSDDAK